MLETVGGNDIFFVSPTVLSTLIFIEFSNFSIDNTSDQHENQGAHYSRENEKKMKVQSSLPVKQDCILKTSQNSLLLEGISKVNTHHQRFFQPAPWPAYQNSASIFLGRRYLNGSILGWQGERMKIWSYNFAYQLRVPQIASKQHFNHQKASDLCKNLGRRLSRRFGMPSSQQKRERCVQRVQ